MARTPRRFVILHGWQNEQPVGHWERWLAERLTERGHDVHYPQLPRPYVPALKEWLEAIEAVIDPAPTTEQVVIAHSLSCAAWVQLCAFGSDRLPVDRVALIAPPSPGFLAGTPELSEFHFSDGAHALVAKSSRTRPRLVCSDNDPYCDPPADVLYGDGFDVDAPARCGHFDLPAGYGSWESMLRWCENPDERIVSRTRDAADPAIA